MRIEHFVSAWAVDHLADALLLVARDGSILDANQAALDCYGCSREELLALTVHDIRADQDQGLIDEQIRKTLESGMRFEAKHRRCDGSVFAVEVRSTRVELDGETAILASIRDISDRVAAQEALAASEDRFRTLFEQSSVAESMTRPGGEVRVNAAFSRLLGYSNDEMAEGVTWRQVSHPDDIPETERYIKALLLGEMASARFEKRYLHKDGSVVWADVSTSLHRDPKGEPEYFMTTIVDITERKHAEEKLHHSSQVTSALLNAITESALMVDVEGRIVAINDTAAQRLGHGDPTALIGQSAWVTVTPEVAAGRVEFFRKVVETKQPATFEDLRRGRHIHNSLNPVVVDGHVTQVAIFGYDMTELDERTRALRESQRWISESQRVAKLGHYVFQIPLGSWTCSEPLREALGITHDHDSDFAEWLEIVHPDDRERMERYFTDEVLGKRLAFDIEYRIVRPVDGVERWVHGRGAVSYDNDDHPVEMVGTIQDITERKQVEDSLHESEERFRALATDLERSNRDLEQFAYVASHDLQEPLRMVASYTELLSQRYLGRLDDDADEFIGFALDGARRMQRMLDDLLEYSRVGTRGQQTHPVDAKSALDQALLNLVTSIEESHAEVVVGEMPTVIADKTQLLRVFQNLLGNAVKFHRPDEHPRIEITATREGELWRFSVADNGIGISPDGFEQVFEVFRRMVPHDAYPGTGIGLSVCRRIVDRLGGSMWVESSGPTGTTFCFTLRAVP